MEFNGVAFALSDKFVNTYKRKRVDFGPLGAFVYARTYARPLPNGKQEVWWQTIRRVVEGVYVIQKHHCAQWHLPWNERRAQRSAQTMFDLMFNFKFLPPGRGLWAMGTEYVFRHGSAGLQNCAFRTSRDIAESFSAPFVWAMDMALHGVGVGFDTEGAHGKEVVLRAPRSTTETHVVEDSREGWVEAFRRVLDAYTGRDTWPASFDYSQIRPAGSPIRGFGGIAPGPEPLIKLISRTQNLLDSYVWTGAPVDSTLIVDLFTYAGEAVVSGGQRRSSLLALGRVDDTSFLDLKSSENLSNPELARWASNNSIVARVGMDYSDTAARATQNGEPGFVWLDNCRQYSRMKDAPDGRDHLVAGVNPCGEMTLHSEECCTLVETFPSRHNSLEEYKLTLKYAYLYAKTVTLLPSHHPATNAVMMRNRRIGLSQTGVVENIAKIGIREHLRWCDEGYTEVRKWDQTYSDWLCVPRSNKVTTIKPSGTTSLLPGVTPGIHFPHSEYYIRRVRVSRNSDVWQRYQEAGYRVEPDAYEKDHTMVIEFPIHEKHFIRGKDSVSLWEQMELAAQLQYWWSDNAVSITVTIRPEDANDLPRALSLYETRLKTVSFLPLRGDKVYAQAPYEAISADQYQAAISGIKSVKLAGASIDQEEERFCDGDSCQL